MHTPRMACCSSSFAYFILTVILWFVTASTAQAQTPALSITSNATRNTPGDDPGVRFTVTLSRSTQSDSVKVRYRTHDRYGDSAIRGTILGNDGCVTDISGPPDYQFTSGYLTFASGNSDDDLEIMVPICECRVSYGGPYNFGILIESAKGATIVGDKAEGWIKAGNGRTRDGRLCPTRGGDDGNDNNGNNDNGNGGNNDGGNGGNNDGGNGGNNDGGNGGNNDGGNGGNNDGGNGGNNDGGNGGNNDGGNGGNNDGGNGGNNDGGNGGGNGNNNGGRSDGDPDDSEKPQAIPASAPPNLTATPGYGEVMLTWQAPEDNGGSPIIGYEYRQRRENEKFDETWIWVDGDGAARETTVTDLENGVTYIFQVRAVNKVGEGDPSNEADATTLMPEVALAAPASSVEEGEDAVFVLKRVDELTRELGVNISMTESGNVLVDGYQAPEQVMFPAGEQEVRLEIATEDDVLDETDGALTLTLVEGDDYEVKAPGTAVVTVRDNDDAPQLTVADANAAEDAGVMVFSVRLNAPSDLPITVDYATSDGTATAGEDYSAADGSLTFMPGDTERPISVLLQEDTIHEGDETFVLTLSNPQNAGLADAAATGTIADNDAMPELTVADARAAEDAGVMVFSVHVKC